jgi:hypothetical protein
MKSALPLRSARSSAFPENDSDYLLYGIDSVSGA